MSREVGVLLPGVGVPDDRSAVPTSCDHVKQKFKGVESTVSKMYKCVSIIYLFQYFCLNDNV